MNCKRYNFMCHTKKAKKIEFFPLSLHFLWHPLLIQYINNNCAFNNVYTNLILIKPHLYRIYSYYCIVVIIIDILTR